MSVSEAMKAASGSLLILIMLQAPCTKAQEAPLPAGRSAPAHLEFGYSYFNISIPSLYRVGLNGVDAGLTIDRSQYFGLELASSYGRTSNVLGKGHPTDFLSYMAGPVVYPLQTKHFSVRIRTLFGGARQVGINTFGKGGTITGFVNKPALALGGGLDYKLDRSWSIRFSTDYLRSSFFDPTGKAKGQNNFRTGVGIVYTFGVR